MIPERKIQGLVLLHQKPREEKQAKGLYCHTTAVSLLEWTQIQYGRQLLEIYMLYQCIGMLWKHMLCYIYDMWVWYTISVLVCYENTCYAKYMWCECDIQSPLLILLLEPNYFLTFELNTEQIPCNCFFNPLPPEFFFSSFCGT